MEIQTLLEDKFTSMWLGLVKSLPLMAIGFTVLILTVLLVAIITRVVKRALKPTRLRPSLQDLIVTLVRVGLWIVGILVATTVVFPSLTPAKLLTALGLGSVAVGLAFKDIFENFFAGVLIMLRRPMSLGDFIECDSISGKVEHISLRETYIRQTDDQLVLVPNSYLFKNPLNVVTDKSLRRYHIVVGVAYDEDVSQARSVIKKSLSGLSTINEQKGIEVYANEFNSSSVDFIVRWWAAPRPIEELQTKDEVVTAVKAALDKAGIEIPFPYRTLTFKEPLAINGLQSDPGQAKAEAQ